MKDELKQKILDVARFEDFMSLKGKGKTLKTTCIGCGKDMSVTPAKGIAKCFKCGKSFRSPVGYLMEKDNMSYPEALEAVARQYGIDTESDANKIKRLKRESKRKKQNIETFCDRQLKESGLSYKDVEVTMTDEDGTRRQVFPFRSGTRNQYYRFQTGSDSADMLIYYYDLEGRPVMYLPERKKTSEQLVRVRWSIPENHLGKDGRPKKYESPKGSGSHLYIPQRIRSAYQTRTPIHRLYIQEGEKKSEKACKHGIMSVGIMGIQNIGGKARVLPAELQTLVQVCEVKEICFILDSDWDDLSSNLENGKPVDQRPRNFFYAVRNFKDYMRNLSNVGTPVEIYFAHINKNDHNEKGVDDLLAGSLAGKEDELKKDIAWAINEKEKIGKYISLFKITTLTDIQIANYWHLYDKDAFFARHIEQLSELKEFMWNRELRRFNEKGELELAQPLQNDERFWDTITKRNSDEITYKYKYVPALRFLNNRGVGRYRKFDGTFDFVHIRNRIIHKIDQFYIRDFVRNFVRIEIKNEEIEEMLLQGGEQYMGPSKLSNLDYLVTNFSRPYLTSQNLYFKDEVWEISADGIKKNAYGQIPYNLWQEQIIDFQANSLEKMIEVEQLEDGNFNIFLSKDAEECHFLTFLLNASNMTWRKKPEDETEEDIMLRSRHLLNKLTAIGYLLHEYRNKSEEVAVIAMDAKLSEVGESNGRTGKSLTGVAIEQIVPQAYINGKTKDMSSDKFLWEDVDEATRNIFLDDARTNIDFEFFFPVITGKMKANKKGEHGQTLANPPKILMTTNHAINGGGGSFKDRQAFMAFSDYYNDKRKPIDDFGVNFFSEWGHKQWNLFYNLMATCLHLYFQSIERGWAGRNKGIVPPPMAGIERRRLRQAIGEETLQWLDEYFGLDESITPEESSSVNINKRIERRELWQNYQVECKNDAKYTNPTGFRKKILAYCDYRNLHYNPGRIDAATGMAFTTLKEEMPSRLFRGRSDKTGGKEYITLANDNYSGNNPF